MSVIRRVINPLLGKKGIQALFRDPKHFCAKQNFRFYSDKRDDTNSHGKIHWENITKDEWRKRLSPQEYDVTREKGTEHAFSGKYYDHHEEGIYKCICCSEELFSSKEKYDSGSGWPSFYSPVVKKDGDDHRPVMTKVDFSHGMIRKEVLCATCNAHLGHVFSDGPPPTGLRYCINGAALDFAPKDEEKSKS